MARWDIFDRERLRETEPKATPEQSKSSADTAERAVGRGATDDSKSNISGRKAGRQRGFEKSTDPRRPHFDRDRAYALRDSEIETLADVGRFRTVDVCDLARFVYRGNQSQLKGDMENLRRQRLIEEKVHYRPHQPPRKLLTLTRLGQRVLQKTGAVPNTQRLYSGFVKERELDHDADLYKVYQQAASRIRSQGGKNIRVRLDFELKEIINRVKEESRQLAPAERAERLAAVATREGLSMNGSSIHLPDIQIEYQTPDGRLERENLELLSQNYREQGLRTKASAGFTLYARSGESGRIKRALNDSGLVREVLSV